MLSHCGATIKEKISIYYIYQDFGAFEGFLMQPAAASRRHALRWKQYFSRFAAYAHAALHRHMPASSIYGDYLHSAH